MSCRGVVVVVVVVVLTFKGRLGGCCCCCITSFRFNGLDCADAIVVVVVAVRPSVLAMVWFGVALHQHTPSKDTVFLALPHGRPKESQFECRKSFQLRCHEMIFRNVAFPCWLLVGLTGAIDTDSTQRTVGRLAIASQEACPGE